MATPFDFVGIDPDITVEPLRRLPADLEGLSRVRPPARDRLHGAPLLRTWRIETRPKICLKGIVFGHPLIGDGRIATTSEILAINPERRWVRTLSRYYA